MAQTAVEYLADKVSEIIGWIPQTVEQEEALELLLRSKIKTANLYYEDMKDWFEQFKKK